MREVVKETKRIMRQASRAYIAERVRQLQQQERRETAAEIRQALKDAGVELASSEVPNV